jgi:4-amino-4-deoxy-L-arabinose transferase-like glycosyltransferase
LPDVKKNRPAEPRRQVSSGGGSQPASHARQTDLLYTAKTFIIIEMAPSTPGWKWVLGLVVLVVGAAIAVPLYRYADRDDAPGGMVIAFLMFVAAAGLAIWVVNPRRESRKPGHLPRR